MDSTPTESIASNSGFLVVESDPEPGDPGTQWYWTSRYFEVPGHGSPNILDVTTTEQLEF